MEMLRIPSGMASSDDCDALDLLNQDHAAIAELFDLYESLHQREEKQALVSRIIRVLTVHARIEQELFYPALHRAIGDDTEMEDADVEHAMIRKLMADLNRSNADASRFDAKMRNLAHLVEQHVEEEERQTFQQARASNLNLLAIGGQLDAYRAALESRYELDTDGKELEAFLSAPTVLGPTTAASASHKVRRPAKDGAGSAPNRKDKPRHRIKGVLASRRRRARRSSRPEAEASEGEST
jgi:hemerythrin superfamily protein